MKKYVKITLAELVGLTLFVSGLGVASGALVGKTLAPEQDTATTVLSAGHLQCKLDNIKSVNEWKSDLIESTKREAATLVKMHIAKTALANMISTE